MSKFKTGFLQSFRNDSLAAQEQLVRHFTKSQSQGKSRCGHERGTVEDASQLHCEGSISHGLGCDEVISANGCLVVKKELNCAHNILERDPTDPLAPGSQLAAKARPKDR
jgi:hypothetical protein